VKTWFITGGTPGGFGMAYAQAALQDGDQVVLTVRHPEQLRDWAQPHGDRVQVVALDVTDPEQIHAAVSTAQDRFGGIDILVNNAGRGSYGSIEGMDEAAVRELFEVNFFAVLAVTRAVLPSMRARHSGWIINMSSAAGLRAVTGFGYYSAAKHAIEATTDILRQEVAPLGIKVLAVEPGAFRTNAYAGFAAEPIGETIEEYQPMLQTVRTAMIEQDANQPGDPQRGVQAVITAMRMHTPPERLVLGSAAYDAVTEKLEAILAGIRAHENLSRNTDHQP
jgi:NAD(P)-dependent dehydrogenase (short-subunit alcohol dehydrogenase family)